MSRRAGAHAAVGGVLLLVLLSCGASSTPSTTRSASSSLPASTAASPRGNALVAEKVGGIRDAVDAVAKRLGGKQRFSEVNATQTEINVFVVADSGAESAFLVRDGAVEAPTSTTEYSGATFGVDDLDFQPTVLDRVMSGITDAELVAFSITPHDGGGVDYIATLTAPSGEFRVLIAADGSVLSTSAISPATGP